MKKEESIVSIIPTKFVELVVEVTAQPIKPTRMRLRYPCIIYSSSKHRAPDCPKKKKGSEHVMN
jgi:hypothetical protein